MDLISVARLKLVWPVLADLVTQLITGLEVDGEEFRVTQGMRSWQEQMGLYAQGRTTPGKVVTNCQGGYSYHNFGMAVDLTPSQFGPGQPYNPDWNVQHPIWRAMIARGRVLGLTSGAVWRTFPDAPHFQLTGRFPEGAPDDEIRQLFRDGGMQAVWDETGVVVPVVPVPVPTPITPLPPSVV